MDSNFYLDKSAVFALCKTFEGFSPGTRITEVIEILEPEGDNSRERALVRIGSVQVAVPLSYLTKLRERNGDTAKHSNKNVSGVLNSHERGKARRAFLKNPPQLHEMGNDG